MLLAQHSICGLPRLSRVNPIRHADCEKRTVPVNLNSEEATTVKIDPHRDDQHACRGVTLVEVLVVITLISLMAGALIFYLAPNDDRRVHIEAQRLAAYLLGASAEAQMRDGPVRVTFDLAGQKYDRERAQLGAQVTEPVWEDDPQGKRQSVRRPVRLTSVEVDRIGSVTKGQAYLNWAGRRTRGGVAILELGKSAYSVVVNPVTGRVVVTRGRVDLPQPAIGSQARLHWPDLDPFDGLQDSPLPTAISDGTGLLGTDLAGGPVGPPGGSNGAGDDKDATVAEHDARFPNQPGAETDPNEGGIGAETTIGDATAPDAAPDGAPDAQLDAEKQQCNEHNDCTGPVERCWSGRCVLDPRGLSYRLRTITFRNPEEVAVHLSHIFAAHVNSNKVNLIVSFDPASGPLGAGPQSFLGYIIQGHPDGQAYRPFGGKPTYRFAAETGAGCPAGVGDVTQAVCVGLVIFDRTGPTSMTLFLDQQVSETDSTTCFLPLSLDVQPTVVFRPGTDRGNASVVIDMRGFLDSERAYEALLPPEFARIVGATNLGQYLDNKKVEKTIDLNGDGDPDAWLARFFGDGRAVDVRGELSEFWGFRPENICEL